MRSWLAYESQAIFEKFFLKKKLSKGVMHEGHHEQDMQCLGYLNMQEKGKVDGTL